MAGNARAYLGILLVVNAAPLSAQPTEPQPVTDWPSTIARLRQETHQWPGLARVRLELAIAYNNYGVELAQQGEWELAKRQLEEALTLDAGNAKFKENLANIHLNQAHEHYTSRRADEAAAAAQQAVHLNPSLADAYVLLGDIDYERQRLRQAREAWQTALRLNPDLQPVTERLARLDRELPIESSFEQITQAFFDLRYEDVLDRPSGFDLRSALLEARREVGSDFAYWPQYKIVVLVYSAESFKALRAKMPEWLVGQYDGKMRVRLPSDGPRDVASVKETLFHEYTHALVHDLSRGNCPRWLNEGLAMYEGKRYGPREVAQLTAAASAGRLIPFGELDRQFAAELPAESVALAYQQSHSLVSYLVERYGFWRMRRILKVLAGGAAFDRALAEEFHLTPERLERAWRDWLPRFLHDPTARLGAV